MRNLFISCGILGLTGVLLGAFGAHALKDLLLAHSSTQIWETAVHYQFVHALALLGLIAWAERHAIHSPMILTWSRRAGWCWTIGIIFFSGSLYGLALGGSRILGPITPIGGLFLMAGWGGLIVVGMKSTSAAE